MRDEICGLSRGEAGKQAAIEQDAARDAAGSIAVARLTVSSEWGRIQVR